MAIKKWWWIRRGRRLELWDIPQDEIDKLEKTGQPGKSLILRSPISGTVLEKQVFAGQYVMQQNDLFDGRQSSDRMDAG